MSMVTYKSLKNQGIYDKFKKKTKEIDMLHLRSVLSGTDKIAMWAALERMRLRPDAVVCL